MQTGVQISVSRVGPFYPLAPGLGKSSHLRLRGGPAEHAGAPCARFSAYVRALLSGIFQSPSPAKPACRARRADRSSAT